MKTRILPLLFLGLLAALPLFRPVAAGAVQYGKWNIRSADDLKRVKDAITIAAAIEDYYKKNRHYPLVTRVQKEFTKVAIADVDLPDGVTAFPASDLEKALSDSAGESVRLPRDPVKSQHRIYFYSTNGQDYWVTVILDRTMPLAQGLSSTSSVLQVGSRPDRDGKINGLRQVKWFLFHGADVMEKQLNLLRDTKNKNFEGLTAALKDDADLDPVCDPTQNCKPLSVAVAGGDVQMVDFLLQNGADVNGFGENDDVPLTTAMRAGHTLVAIQLIQAGADVNRANKFGVTPFIGAVHDGRVEIVKQMLTHGANLDEHYLSDDNAETPGDFGERPLEAAINAKSEQLVKILLDAGADTTLKGQYGSSLQDLGDATGNAKISALLKQAGKK